MKRLLPFCLLILILPALAYTAEEESKPTLMSTTGGGNTWATPKELQRDAELGKPSALTAYGEALLTGDQVAKDVPQALQYLERAAKAGQSSAAFRLGKLYDDGELTTRDPAKAVEYYKQAAIAGVSEAQYNLGALFMNGKGIKRDYKEGLAWLIVARKNGADPSVEQQVRQRFQSTRREQIIAAAEARANELAAEISKSHPMAPAASANGGPK